MKNKLNDEEEMLIEECYDNMKCYPILLYTPTEIKKAMRKLLCKYKEYKLSERINEKIINCDCGQTYEKGDTYVLPSNCVRCKKYIEGLNMKQNEIMLEFKGEKNSGKS